MVLCQDFVKSAAESSILFGFAEFLCTSVFLNFFKTISDAIVKTAFAVRYPFSGMCQEGRCKGFVGIGDGCGEHIQSFADQTYRIGGLSEN